MWAAMALGAFYGFLAGVIVTLSVVIYHIRAEFRHAGRADAH